MGCFGPHIKEEGYCLLREAAYYLRMSLGVLDWVKAPRFPDVAELFRRNVEEREANFLRLTVKGAAEALASSG